MLSLVRATRSPSRALSSDSRASLLRLFSPDSAAAARSPTAWLDAHLTEVQAALRTHGVVLLRGFGIEEPDTFRALAERVGGPLGDSYHGPSPRQSVSKSVYTASEVPSALVIPEHAEMSYLPRMTRHLFFWCRQPATSGGATTFVDGRAVLSQLDPQKVARLLAEPVRIRRRHAARVLRLDPFELKPWPDMFGTHDRHEALARARDLGFQARFDRMGAITLESEQRLVREHPVTGELAWLNHLLVFHASAPAALLASAFEREGKLGAGALHRLALAYRAWSERIGRDVPADVRHVDGAPIPDDVVSHVRGVVDALATPLHWQRGDLAIVDNHVALHGRRPFTGPRRLAVAFSAAFA